MSRLSRIGYLVARPGPFLRRRQPAYPFTFRKHDLLSHDYFNLPELNVRLLQFLQHAAEFVFFTPLVH